MQFGDEQFYKALLNDMTTFVAVLDIEGTILFVNNTPLDAVGCTLESLLGKKFWDAPWWDYSAESTQGMHDDVMMCSKGESLLHEIQLKVGDGSLIWIEYSMHPIFNEAGEVQYLVPEGRNIHEKKLQEEALRHTQKMDAIGKLTAGIAHDYNNMLGIISGYTQLLELELADNPKLQEYVQNIEYASKRSQNLTQKLLSFSKQKAQKLEVCNINAILDEQNILLEKTLMSQTKVHYKLEENIYLTEFDSNDFEDVMLNLCINASHAMPDGGDLHISTHNINLEEKEYIHVALRDTGIGMDKDTLSKIFDPFFTTKGEKGTGLGMSQVFGFIEKIDAKIKVTSTLGEGTTINMYFLKSSSASASASASANILPKKKTNILNNKHTILVVDDEKDLAKLTTEVLNLQGYTVFTAHHATQALEILSKESIELLVSDVIMPDVTGYELAGMVHEYYPKVKIQMMSGFEGEVSGDEFTQELHNNILEKPYDINVLLERVAMLLEG